MITARNAYIYIYIYAINKGPLVFIICTPVGLAKYVTKRYTLPNARALAESFLSLVGSANRVYHVEREGQKQVVMCLCLVPYTLKSHANIVSASLWSNYEFTLAIETGRDFRKCVC